jgi:hypothetical protein
VIRRGDRTVYPSLRERFRGYWINHPKNGNSNQKTINHRDTETQRKSKREKNKRFFLGFLCEISVSLRVSARNSDSLISRRSGKLARQAPALSLFGSVFKNHEKTSGARGGAASPMPPPFGWLGERAPPNSVFHPPEGDKTTMTVKKTLIKSKFVIPAKAGIQGNQ